MYAALAYRAVGDRPAAAQKRCVRRLPLLGERQLFTRRCALVLNWRRRA